MARRSRKKKTGVQHQVIQPQAGAFHPLVENWIGPWRVVAVFAGLTLLYTLPLIFSLGGSIMGKYHHSYGDIFWAIWQFWSAKVQLLELHSSPFRFDLIAGPYNQSSVFTLHKSPTVMLPFTAVFGPVPSVNLYVLFNFILSGFLTWLLVRELTGNNLAGIVSGMAFAFCPYAYARSIVHLDLAPIWTFPFLFYGLFRLYWQPGWRSWALLALAILAFGIYACPYYYLILPLGFVSWLLVRFVDRFFYEFSSGRKITGAFARVSSRQWAVVAVAAVVLIAGSTAAYVLYLGPTAALVQRPLHWQERFALSLANYLIPGGDHPLFGSVTSQIVPIRRNLTESAIYVGWVPLVLAIYGLRSSRRDWRAWLLILFGLGAFSITLGPHLTLGPMKIPMPSLLIHKLAPFIRSIGRYGIFVQLSVAVLAGYGMAELIRRREGRRSIDWLLAGLILLLAVEYSHPLVLTRVATRPEESPPVYAKLATLENEAMLFEYPPVAVTGMTNTDYFFFQTIHKKQLFNRFFDVTNIPEEYFPFWLEMDYPGAITDPVNVRLLKYFDVDYVIRHERNHTGSPHLPLADFSRAEGLELVEDFGTDAIYRITAEPATVMLTFDTRPFYNYSELDLKLKNEGFEPPLVPHVEGQNRIGWRFMLGRGTIRVCNLLDKPQRVDLRALALSLGAPRRIRASLEGSIIGEYTLSNAKVTQVTIQGINLPAGKSVELLLESLDGTTSLKILYRSAEFSAAFTHFDLTPSQAK